MKDFFISYNGHDQEWATWIASVLEAAGYSVIIQAWDFRPGMNFVEEMHRATKETRRTIAVLSEHFLSRPPPRLRSPKKFPVDTDPVPPYRTLTLPGPRAHGA